MSATSSSHGILASGVYMPRLRLERAAVAEQHGWMTQGSRRAKGARALASWDEDSITMAVEAARAVLDSRARTAVDELTLVSTTLPFANRLNAGVVAGALGLPEGVLAADVASSRRATATQLVRLLARPTAGEKLLIGVDRRIARPASPQELQIGDGAAGVVVGEGEPLATLVASWVRNVDFVDTFREAGRLYDYGWEERWVREEGYLKIAVGTLADCLRAAGVEAAQVAHFVLPAPLPRANELVAKKLGIAPERVVPADVAGDLGCAQVLSMLDAALRSAADGDLILVGAFGSGCDALLLRRTAKAAPVAKDPFAGGKVERSYLKYLSFTGQLVPDWGMRAEVDVKTALTAAWREVGTTARLEAGKCQACGTIQFPMSRTCVNPRCHQVDTQQPTSLVDIPARVMSYTCDWLGFTPAPPFQFGHVDFEGGGRILMEFADADPEELKVGLPLRMVYRVKEFDPKRGFRRYFWKATPARASSRRE